MVSREGDGLESSASVVSSDIPILSRIWGILSPDSPRVASNFAIRAQTFANDNVYWLGEDDSSSSNGVFGSDVDAATLAGGDSVVAWVGDDQIVHARLIPAEDDADISASRAASNATLNELLANLGEAGQGAAAAQGRLKLVTLGQNGLAAFWISELGLTAALLGKAILSQISTAEAHDGAEPATTWTVSDVSPVTVPKGASGISVKVSADGSVKVVVDGHGAENVEVNLAVIHDADGAGVAQIALADGGDKASPSSDDGPLTEVRHGSGSTFGLVANDHQDGHDIADEASAQKHVDDDRDGRSTSGTGSDADHVHTHSAAPLIVLTQSGIPIAIEVLPGSEPGTSTIQFSIVGEEGGGAPTVVTENAITSDAGNPTLDLQPAVAATDDGVGFAWLEASPTASGAPVYELKLQSFNADGHSDSATPATVAVTTAVATSISDFAIAYLGGDSHEDGDDEHEGLSETATQSSGDGGSADDDDAAAVPPPGNASASADTASAPAAANGESGSTISAPEASIAVVWVQNADDSGYGEIMGQLYAIVGGSGEGSSGDGSSGDNSDNGVGQLVALGCDGAQGGSGDDAFAISDEGSQGSAVVGRAPSVASVGSHAVVVTWAHDSGLPGGGEIIGGVILQTHGDYSYVPLDLSDLMTHGLVAGTDPQVMSTDGDIVITWLQVGDAGGYDAAAAVFEHSQSGEWSKPGAALILSHFDAIPDNLQISLTDENNPEIVVTWQEGSRTVSGQTFDLDGQSSGQDFSYRSSGGDGNSGSGSGGDSNSDSGNSGSGSDGDSGSDNGGLSAAMLPDGQLLVVFSQDGDSNSGVGAVIVNLGQTIGDTTDVGTVDSAASDLGSALALVDEANDLIVINLNAVANSASLTSGTTAQPALETDAGGSGAGDASSSDGLIFVPGYGNDIADYVDETHLFDDTTLLHDPIADAFDALQYANALYEGSNMEVITFDASNIVVIRDFETLGS